MAEELASKNSKGFWEKVKYRRGQKPATAENLEGLRKKEEVSELFAKNFSAINGCTRVSSPPTYTGGGGFRASFLNDDVRLYEWRVDLRKDLGLMVYIKIFLTT